MMRRGDQQWQKRDEYAEMMYQRATGNLPEMESSKALTTILTNDLQEGNSILDVGCGAGHYLRSLLNQIAVPFTYTGVDATPLFIDAAQKAWQPHPRATFMVDDIFDLSFADRQFDVVICNNVLQSLPSIETPVQELLRVARRCVLIRTIVGTRSFRIQEVYSRETWPYSDIQIENQFDADGEPVSFGFVNIYTTSYFEQIIRRTQPGCTVEFIEDTFFDPERINQSAASVGAPNATRIIANKQVFGDHILVPWHFIKIQLPQ